MHPIEVPGETVVKDVVQEVMVPGETVIKEVVKEVPVEKIVTQEVVKEVMVPGETVVKEVVKTVEVPKIITQEKVVTEVVVETVEVSREPKCTLLVADVVPALTQLQSKDASGSVGGPSVAWQVYEGIINPQLTGPGVIPSEELYDPNWRDPGS